MMQWIQNHTLFLLLSGATVLTFFWLYQFRTELRIHSGFLPFIAVLHTLLGVASVKCFAVLETLNLDNAGKMSLFGAVFFMPLVYFIGAKVLKQERKDVFDIFTPVMLISLLSARINCILSGCCRGKIIPGTTDLRYPTRQTEIIFYIIIMFFLARSVWKRESKGRNYPIYLMAYGCFRFVIEWLRDENSPFGWIHMGHIWALVSIAIGWSIYAELEKRLKKRGYKHA
ncbi:MAG: prolipoprotein diacylglyceryl transferase [Lachnospiraceae bacterium]|nr:prolipoprotein diacylglyceryl transferase [Lachnospiraceae bacterium]